jgi:D-glycero-alpha-D-manno-heptose-7-phosphate kinase
LRRSPVTASAPTRIDLAGGTLDIWPISVLVPGALTLNLAISLRARVRITPRSDRKVVIVSRDQGKRASAPCGLDPGRARGPLSLLLRLALAFRPERGLTLESEAEAPAGSGLGGSSTLGIAAAAALARFTGERLGKEALLRRVQNLEAIELRVPTGTQDYLAALHGGLAAYEHGPDGTARRAIPIPAELPRRIVVAYAGEAHRSGFSNWDMFRRFVEGETLTVRRMEEIARLARQLRDALVARDLDEAGRIVGEEGRLRYRLAPTVATPTLLRVDAAARRAGALGVKVCGAGGGGCQVAFSREGRSGDVREAMIAAGARILPVRIERRGVIVSGR